MISIDELHKINRFADDLKELESELKMLELSPRGWLGVTFQGKYQNNETIDIVVPALITYKKNQIYVLKRQLMELGIDSGINANV